MAYTKKESFDEQITQKISGYYTEMISMLGEDVDRDGLTKTPERAAKAMQFLTQGYDQDAGEILKSALFKI